MEKQIDEQKTGKNEEINNKKISKEEQPSQSRRRSRISKRKRKHPTNNEEK